MESQGEEYRDALARRQRVLAPTYRLFYDEPLYVKKAEGVWLHGADGRRYLDAYNNVPVVGHCHPHVVECIVRQAAVLNTHTRYLTDAPIELGERLLATLPREINCVTFTCSGSEANDLAMRVCKSVTGGQGAIVTEFAYHGTTETLAGMSPVTGQATAHGVFKARIDPVRNDATAFALQVEAAIGQMRAAGIRPAALLVDTIFGSDGVVPGPAGFLQPAVAAIRAAGGLFVADEVQPGFGRTGEGIWGFQRHGVVPDLVSMGKPMGNGHPVAALCARREVMENFARSTRYFNTFGGNTVACAAALAVLDVLERERVLANALAMGERLQRGISQLAARHACVSSVRGAGLFIGMQLQPPQLAARVVNAAKREGVLVGTAGGANDTIKIRPPLVIGADEVDLLVSGLDRALAAASPRDG
ncbi:MAG: aminotransferase class III-fold pyridoxal phosphate-dependent enzyme [Proteobacteria bacterium]|nr:aminotransferase class III-fold pyridoxal phosphate-dependent enzyme [Pseudomonadota bacterium]